MAKPIGKKKTGKVLARDDHTCVIRLPDCQGVATVADHRRSRGQGGARSLDEFSNLIAACGLCNGAKEDSKGEVRALLEARGVIITAGRTHAHEAQKARETPVYYPNGRRYELDDAGGLHELPT